MISLNYRDSRPIYEQIRDGLRKLIVTGALSADEKLPSVRALAAQLACQRYHLVLANIVADVIIALAPAALDLMKPGGAFLAMKSVESDAELAASQHAIAILGGAVEAVRDYAIPGTDVRHRLIVVEKVKKTPEKYPRMFAKIKKNPL